MAFGLMFFTAASAVLAGTMILVHNSMNYTLNLLIAAPDRPFRASDETSMSIIADSMQRNLFAKGSLAVVGVGVVVTIAGWVVSGRLLRPLSQITETARRIAGRTLHRRLDLDLPPGEVKSLADSFDSMLDRLDQAFAGQRRFISNAAHELKTPLAINRTLLEVAMLRLANLPEVTELAANLLAVNARQERLIDSLLTLAQAEDELAEHTPVDFAALVDATATQAAPEAERQQIALTVQTSPTTTVGDAVLLEHLVRNLVSNAIRYNVEGGWVRVSAVARPNEVELVVSNTGPVVSPHEVPRLFEPFRRLTDRVGTIAGSGLGLSIVRAVARAHGGDVAACPRVCGGLWVRVVLPAVTQPTAMTELALATVGRPGPARSAL